MNQPQAFGGTELSRDSEPVSLPDAMDEATRVIPRQMPASSPPDDGATVVLPRPATARPVPTIPGMSAGIAVPMTSAPATGSGAASAGAAHESILLPIGARLADFEITGVVGQGGFGVVYRAWDHALEREVAIKEYLPSSLASRQADGTVAPLSQQNQETFDAGMRSFFNEARLLAQFDHPSLLKVYRFWQERGTTYMVMPLYKGQTLKNALAAMGSEVDEAWLLSIMDGVTQALAVMHQANCYHRDIAPDNILLLEGSGRPVVLDFGAARKVITDMAQAITVILKPGYAPIEQYAEVPDMTQGAWTDVYALGAVMHVAVCGRPPPPSVARMLNDRYVPLATNEVISARYSQRLLQSIDAALSVRPENRPQSMAALRDSLGLSQGGVSIPVTLPGAAPQVAASASTGPATATQGAKDRKGGQLKLVGGLALLAVVVLAGGGWWMTRAPEATTPVAATSGSATAPAGATSAAVAAPTPAAPFDPVRALQELGTSPPGGFEVVATPAKTQVRIGKDQLAFSVRSSHAGYVYVYMFSTTGELFQLFPNQLDGHNQIKAGETLQLPRKSWLMDVGGPAGTDQFAVVVSERERDLSGSGIQRDGVFGQFPIQVLAALETARGGRGASSLLGKAVCEPNAPCSEAYGATAFRIVEE